MLVIRCPRCNKNNAIMANFWDEYLCEECLKKEYKPLRQRIIEARKDKEQNNG